MINIVYHIINILYLVVHMNNNIYPYIYISLLLHVAMPPRPRGRPRAQRFVCIFVHVRHVYIYILHICMYTLHVPLHVYIIQRHVVWERVLFESGMLVEGCRCPVLFVFLYVISISNMHLEVWSNMTLSCLDRWLAGCLVAGCSCRCCLLNHTCTSVSRHSAVPVKCRQ